MGRKKPTDNGVITPSGSPIGLGRIIEYIGQRFSLAFNIGEFPDTTPVTEPILQIFGLVDKYEDSEGKKYPVGYNNTGGTLTDPINLLPTDRWHGFMFADYDDPVTLSIPEAYRNTQRNWYNFKVKVAFVFFFNMKRQKYYVKWGDDYRIQKEKLMQRVVSILTKDSVHKGARFEITEIFDRSIEAVWKGYTVKESALQGNLQPYYAIRIESVIEYKQVCTPSVPLPPLAPMYWDYGSISLKEEILTFVPFARTMPSTDYNIKCQAWDDNGVEKLVNVPQDQKTTTGFYAMTTVDTTMNWEIKVRL